MQELRPAIYAKHFDLFTPFGNEIDPMRLFYGYFQQIPNIRRIKKVNCQKTKKWFEASYPHLIPHSHTIECYNRDTGDFEVDDFFYVMPEGVILCLDQHRASIYFQPSAIQLAEELGKKIVSFTLKEKINQTIKMVIDGSNGLETYGITIKKPSLDLNLHYNEDLASLHVQNMKNLKTKDKSGLYLFYGLPGTGKSTYIRYLIRSINKEVVFIPPGLAANFDSASLSKFLMNQKNTVFVIEDAEELLISRDLNKNSNISMLLNLTDGLLGETLGIQIIATFNTDLNNIDKALLRKGRLLGMYEFKSLSINRSTALLEKRGIKPAMVHQPMTLAEIFNKEQIDYQYQKANRPAIGFLSNKG